MKYSSIYYLTLPPQACLPPGPQGVMRPPGLTPRPLQPQLSLPLAGALMEHAWPQKGPAPEPIYTDNCYYSDKGQSPGLQVKVR